jgi:hypothetical protein
VRKRIEAHLRWLQEGTGAGREGQLERVVKERAALLMSVPGVAPTLSATLLWRSCPSWSTSTAGGSPRWSGSRPSTGTPVPCAGYARCGAVVGAADEMRDGHDRA